MCGGCPGGVVISALSALVTRRGIKAQVTRELSARCAPRFRVVAFGDSWVVSSATGKQTVCASIEAAALAVVGAVAGGGARPGRQPHRGPDGLPRFPDPETLTPVEFVDAVLWLAAAHPAGLEQQ